MCLPDRDIPLDQKFKVYGERISSSMSIGQPLCVIQVVYLNREYKQDTRLHTFVEYDGSDRLVHSPPVLDFLTKQPILTDRESSIHYTMMEPILPVIEWIENQGMYWVLLCESCGKLFLGDPDVSDWAQIAVYVDMSVLEKRSGYLSSLWKGAVANKCVDDSLQDTWYQRVKNAMRCGQVGPTVICCLYENSDYGLKKGDQEFHCPSPIHWMTHQAVPDAENRQYFLDSKFRQMLAWVHHNKYRWTLCFEVEYGDVSEWAYFMVYPKAPFGIHKIKEKAKE